MTRNIIWKGLDDESLEFCRIDFRELITVRSSIIGLSDDVPFKVDYELELSKDWIISSFGIKALLGNVEHALHLSHNGYGNWFNNEQEWKHLEGCLDIDISFTPFTNSLPINRIKSGLDQKTNIQVVYIDVMNFAISKELQYYQLLENKIYNFSNSDGSFTADIIVDELNLVKYYPNLFERLVIKN